MQVALTDGLVFETGRAQRGDDSLLIRFYKRILPDPEASASAGCPKFKEVPFIKIRAPGQTDECDERVTEEHRERFAPAWRRFEADNSSEGITGTVLDEWPLMPRTDVETFKTFSIRTVEQLAAQPDATLKKIPGGPEWRDSANAWLGKAKDASAFSQLEAQVRALTNEVATIKRERDEAMKALDKATDPKRK